MKTFGIPWPEFNQGLHYTDIVKNTSSLLSSSPNSTLIDFYSSKYTSSAPRKGWLQRIHNGQITIDGKVVTDPDTVLRTGSKLVYHRIPWREPLTPYKLHVLFEDDQLLVVNKPSGLQVLPGGLFQQRTVLTQLQWRTGKSAEYGPEELCPVPVHRLGRGTSGILLCAKTQVAKSKLAADFADGTSAISNNRCSDMNQCNVKRRISKTYRALAKGLIEQDEICIKQPIGKIQYPGVESGLYVASPTGKPAESRLLVLSRDKVRNCTLVEVEIFSGRPHQIRIHLSYIGHPLIGDPLYVAGGRPSYCSSNNNSDRYDVKCFAEDGGYERPLNAVPGDCGYYLHATWLCFNHPISDEELRIFAPPQPILRTFDENARMDDSESDSDHLF